MRSVREFFIANSVAQDNLTISYKFTVEKQVRKPCTLHLAAIRGFGTHLQKSAIKISLHFEIAGGLVQQNKIPWLHLSGHHDLQDSPVAMEEKPYLMQLAPGKSNTYSFSIIVAE